MPLYGVDFAYHFRKHRSRVAGAGADPERAITGARLNTFDHKRDNIRLRNGLPSFDWKGSVLVCEFAEVTRQKRFARHTLHRSQYGQIAHSVRRYLIAN